MDIFEKCSAPSLAKELKEAGVYPYFHALQSRQDVEVQMEGKRRIMLGSNNYLGLTIAPDVVEAGIHALERYGTGCSGSRFLNGTLEMHLELEAELGKFLRKPGIVTFGTGFQANVGIISALVDRHDYVICDRENHASIYAGLEPRAEGDDAGLTQKLPQFLLQLQMHLEGAVEEPGATAPGAVLLQGMDARLHHIRGRGQTQIVVGTQHDAAPTLHHHLHILPGLEGVEIGIHPRRLQFLRQRRLIAFLKNIHSSLLLCNIKY